MSGWSIPSDGFLPPDTWESKSWTSPASKSHSLNPCHMNLSGDNILAAPAWVSQDTLEALAGRWGMGELWVSCPNLPGGNFCNAETVEGEQGDALSRLCRPSLGRSCTDIQWGNTPAWRITCLLRRYFLHCKYCNSSVSESVSAHSLQMILWEPWPHIASHSPSVVSAFSQVSLQTSLAFVRFKYCGLNIVRQWILRRFSNTRMHKLKLWSIAGHHTNPL